MKKLMLIAAMIVVGGAVYAQTTTASASITLSGTVEKNVAITATGLGSYNDLDLTSDQSNLAVAEINEYANVREGYTVSLSSANAVAGNTADPYFEGQVGGETLTYSLSYDGSAVTLSGGSAQIIDANAKTPLGGVTKQLAITYSGSAANLGNDTYADDLTFTITAK